MMTGPDEPELVAEVSHAASMTAVFPDRMWANSSWFASHVGMGPAVIGYSQVQFTYNNGLAQSLTAPIGSNGSFSRYLTAGQAPRNGDLIHVTWSGASVGEVGCDLRYRYTGGAVYSFAEMGCVVAPLVPNVLINEVLANEPGSDTAGEFIELVNIGTGTASLAGWSLADGRATRHVFGAGATLAPGKALVVFGGAAAIPPGLGNAVAASTGALGLNNQGGDQVALRAPDGITSTLVIYGNDLSSIDGTSMNRSPDGALASQREVLHTTISSLTSSPGMRSSGAPW